MRRYSKYILVAGALAALGAPSAAMAGGNSGNAQACQQGGWQTLVRQDGTAFANQSDCVSYGANGGTLYHSENFSEDALGSQPTTFSGGTIDSAYGVSPADAPWFPAGGVLNQSGGY
jgi:hypothetical protein